MISKSMENRIRRIKAAARRKKIAELEGTVTSPRRQKIAELEAAIKSESTDKDDGQGKKPGSTASDKYNRKKIQPKPKGNKSESKLDKSTGDAEPVGYPFSGDTDGGLGRGNPKADSKKSKQKALNDADKKRKELTSETPHLKTTPKPKLSASKQKNWRKAKIAELKRALTNEEAENLDTTELESSDLQDITDQASKQQRVPAAQVLEQAKKLVPLLTQQLQHANDMLEDAIMGNNLQKVKGALAFLLTQIQQITKGEIVPLGATIRKLMGTLSPKQAASTKYASLVQGAHMVSKLDDEFSRARHLIRMSAKHISL